MFEDESNLTFNFIDESTKTVPKSIETVDCTLSPYECNNHLAGSYIIGQYANIINFRKTANATALSESEIKSKIYTPAATSNGLITLSRGMKACATKIFSRNESDVVYFKDVTTIKRYIHKYHAIVVELYLSTTLTTQNGTFKITKDGTKIKDSDGYTKGFVAIGYDSTGLLVQNSLGTKYGSLGFALIKWSVVNKWIVKAAAIENIFN